MNVHRRAPALSPRSAAMRGPSLPARARSVVARHPGVERGAAFAPASERGVEPVGERPRILVVEDEALVAMATSQLLEDAGYEVVGMAADSAQALRLADEQRPELVLMDIRLRGGDDGVDTALEIRRRFGSRILYVSAHGDAATLARAAKTDPAGFVGKPHTTQELLNAVARALVSG